MPTGPNQLWVSDITYVALPTRFIYVAVILDAWSRLIVGYAVSRSSAAIVQRAGPEMLSMLRGPMMGENKARFGSAIEEMVDCERQSRRSSQLHLI